MIFDVMRCGRTTSIRAARLGVALERAALRIRHPGASEETIESFVRSG